jgi:hypothetical protein
MTEEENAPTAQPASAPTPPPLPIKARPRRGSGKHAQRIRAGSVRSASNWVLALAILQLLFGAVFGFSTKRDADTEIARIERMVTDAEVGANEAAPAIAEWRRAVARSFAIPVGLGVAFFALWLWARKSALPALCTALGLFVIVHFADAIVDPAAILRGVLLKILVVGALASGIKSALQQRAIAQRQAEPAA